jgi:hypothetical protein
MFTFDRFDPGAVLGTESWVFDEAALEEWKALFPDDAACAPRMPPGMVAVVAQQCFMRIFTDRPPGNIHTGQLFRLAKLPRLGDTIATELCCLKKELRKEKRWITVGSTARSSTGEIFFIGEMTLIWAA